MQTTLLVILTLLLITTLVVLFFLYNKLQAQNKPKEGEQNMFLLLQQQMQELNKTMDQKMSDTHKTVGEAQENIHKTIQGQFAQSSKIITDITEKLTTLDKTNQQVIGFSEQLSNLEKVLKSQKQRGNLGEAGLKLVLENMLPPGSFHLQYEFPDGDTVDALIITKDGNIPVDAKFSLDNYRRVIDAVDDNQKEKLEIEFKNDLKKRIDETAKYIKPKDGTLEFAFMFIPSEAIYYDLLVNEVGAVKINTRNLIDYAFNEKKVIIVSPTTFAAYLQTVLQGLRAFKIEEGAKSIRKNVEMLGKHIAAYEDYMKKLGMSMTTTVNHYNTAYKELGKIDKDVVRITEGEKVIEPELLDKPKVENN
ncbi:MAG: DNA recombination protein RmuC [Candidatus Magasanikbacteria bacterium CG_4_10_14_0_2_um_filter_37_12]|uniref:DNA recombination protein RmuC n=1 Tax=Candidatus Magasanikbacteria bacterium CG_4_10_14_0_2_um_filter_37_12 TaxID=1974637 RepID=A0A2M7V776_9BACT|nr:MAG: DNA recombination protein RmuC [Candidatus Magasanikbacteria bacterium CG_4_10_14_0_2_um_filter_37_12]